MGRGEPEARAEGPPFSWGPPTEPSLEDPAEDGVWGSLLLPKSGVQQSGHPHGHESMTLGPLIPFQNSPDSPLDENTVALNENVCDKAFQERIGAVKVC